MEPELGIRFGDEFRFDGGKGRASSCKVEILALADAARKFQVHALMSGFGRMQGREQRSDRPRQCGRERFEPLA